VLKVLLLRERRRKNMTYEKPEAVEIGSAEELVLGQKLGTPLESSGQQRLINPMTDFDE
jgi:hypothetical protein